MAESHALMGNHHVAPGLHAITGKKIFPLGFRNPVEDAVLVQSMIQKGGNPKLGSQIDQKTPVCLVECLHVCHRFGGEKDVKTFDQCFFDYVHFHCRLILLALGILFFKMTCFSVSPFSSMSGVKEVFLERSVADK